MKTATISALWIAVALLAKGQDPPPAEQKKKSDPGVQAAGEAQTDPSRLAPPPAGEKPAADALINEKTYVIGPEDQLNILVWGNRDLSGPVLVRPDGIITLGLINDVKAAGLTPEQLTTEISNRLKDGGFMQAPRVTVAVQQVNSKKACIVGEVYKPGCFNLVVPTTVLEALVNAGGFKDFANQKSIAIQRGEQRFAFNYKRVIAGKNREQNIQLEPGDLIIVK